jgi:hypothetical protein
MHVVETTVSRESLTPENHGVLLALLCFCFCFSLARKKVEIIIQTSRAAEHRHRRVVSSTKSDKTGRRPMP